MSNFEQTYAILVSSCLAINQSRSQWTAKWKKIYTEAVGIVNATFASWVDIQNSVEAELLYLEQESAFSRPSGEQSFADAIASYHYALDVLKILINEPEMYKKYCAPACQRVTTSKGGVPKDAFCYALNSHKTRLQNHERYHGVTDEEGEILILRLENIRKALKAYKELQKQVLGL